MPCVPEQHSAGYVVATQCWHIQFCSTKLKPVAALRAAAVSSDRYASRRQSLSEDASYEFEPVAARPKLPVAADAPSLQPLSGSTVLFWLQRRHAVLVKALPLSTVSSRASARCTHTPEKTSRTTPKLVQPLQIVLHMQNSDTEFSYHTAPTHGNRYKP